MKCVTRLDLLEWCRTASSWFGSCLIAATAVWAQPASLVDFEGARLFHFGGAESRFVDDVASTSSGFAALALTSVVATGEGAARGFVLHRLIHLAPDAAPRLVMMARPDPDHDVTLGLRLQEDGDGLFGCSADGEFGHDVVLEQGTEWQRIDVAFDVFDDLNDAGNGRFDPVTRDAGGTGGLVNITVELVDAPSEYSVAILLDDIRVTDGSRALAFVADFEKVGRFLSGDGKAELSVVRTGEVASSGSGRKALRVTTNATAAAFYPSGVGVRRRAHLPVLETACCLAFSVQPDPNRAFTLRIQLEDDDNNNSVFDVNDDEVYSGDVFVPAGNAMRRFEVVYSDFVDDNDGGNGTFGPVSARGGGNGELLGVRFEASDLDPGTSLSFVLDDVVLAGADLRPFTLVEWHAVPDGATRVLLSWTTTSEHNNVGFEVQHRRQGDSAFVQAGFVEGRGTTAERDEYVNAVDDLSEGVHIFRLRQVGVNGTVIYSPVVELDVASTTTAPRSVEMDLRGPAPNPFHTSTQLEVELARRETVRIDVFDVLGRLVATLHDAPLAPGAPHVFLFAPEAPYPAGIYYARVTTPSAVVVRSMVHARK